jgi:hypothetical protein
MIKVLGTNLNGFGMACYIFTSIDQDDDGLKLLEKLCVAVYLPSRKKKGNASWRWFPNLAKEALWYTGLYVASCFFNKVLRNV